jgi:hypothetical protein
MSTFASCAIVQIWYGSLGVPEPPAKGCALCIAPLHAPLPDVGPTGGFVTGPASADAPPSVGGRSGAPPEFDESHAEIAHPTMSEIQPQQREGSAIVLLPRVSSGEKGDEPS